MYSIINDKSELDLYAEEEDMCYICSNMNYCPLMAALKNEVVILRFEAIAIESCGLFESLENDFENKKQELSKHPYFKTKNK